MCKRDSCSPSKKTQDAADLLAKVETDSWSEQGATSRWKGRPKDRSGVEQESLRGRRARRSLSLALEGSKPSFCSAMKLINPRSGMKHLCCAGLQEEPGGPGGAGVSQEPGGARRSQEEPGGARTQDPVGPRGSYEDPGGPLSIFCLFPKISFA